MRLRCQLFQLLSTLCEHPNTQYYTSYTHVVRHLRTTTVHVARAHLSTCCTYSMRCRHEPPKPREALTSKPGNTIRRHKIETRPRASRSVHIDCYYALFQIFVLPTRQPFLVGMSTTGTVFRLGVASPGSTVFVIFSFGPIIFIRFGAKSRIFSATGDASNRASHQPGGTLGLAGLLDTLSVYR